MPDAAGDVARIVNWNLEWATPTSKQGRELRRRIDAELPDVVCLTETSVGFFGDEGYTIGAEGDTGYSGASERRKVLLWSREPWTAVDAQGSPSLPGGRFVRGVTQTPAGPIDFWGLCIPWRDAHVRTGRRDRRMWEDHAAYLGGLGSMLASAESHPRAALGDFNQRIPRKSAPRNSFEQLEATFSSLSIVTAGIVPGVDRQTIDHVAVSRHIRAVQLRGLSATHEGRELSDHFGVLVAMRRSERAH